MKKRINEKGFTLAEALVAMLLVAIMAAGVIVALMSTKRAIVAPTNREEMLFAIEEVSSILQSLSATDAPICPAEDTFYTALEETPNCGQSSTQNCHDVSCKAPNSCKGANDFFVYSVVDPAEETQENTQDQKYISFMISCEGQTI